MMLNSFLKDMLSADPPETPPDNCPFDDDTFVIIDKYNLDQIAQDSEPYTEDLTLDIDDHFFKPPAKPRRPQAVSMLEQEMKSLQLRASTLTKPQPLFPPPEFSPPSIDTRYNPTKLFDYPNRLHILLIPYLSQVDIGHCRQINKRWCKLFTQYFYSHMTLGTLSKRNLDFNRSAKDKLYLLAATRKQIQKVTIQGTFQKNLFKHIDCEYMSVNELNFVDFKPFIIPQYHVDLQEIFPSLSKVHFSDSIDWKESAPKLHIKPMSNLQHLSFRNRRPKICLPKFFKDTITNSPNLTRLALVNTRVEPQDLNHLRKNVKFLYKLEMVNWFGDHQFEYSHFETEWRQYLREHSYISNPIDPNTPFQCQLSESQVQSFQSYLKHFHESNGRSLDEWLAKLLQQNDQLRIVRLEQLGYLEYSLKYLAKTAFNTLTHFSLGSVRINPKYLNHVFTRCTNLSFVKLYLLLDLNDEHIDNLTLNNPKLNTLELDFVPITDNAVNFIRSRLNQLTDLKLKRLTRVQFKTPSKREWACYSTLQNFDFFILPDYIRLDQFLLPFTRLVRFSFLQDHFEPTLTKTLQSAKPNLIIEPIKRNVFNEA